MQTNARIVFPRNETPKFDSYIKHHMSRDCNHGSLSGIYAVSYYGQFSASSLHQYCDIARSPWLSLCLVARRRALTKQHLLTLLFVRRSIRNSVPLAISHTQRNSGVGIWPVGLALHRIQE